MQPSEAFLASKRHINARRTTLSILKFFALLIILLVVIAPIVWMVITSFKSNGEMYKIPINYWPQEPTTEHYEVLFGKDYLLQNIWNSIQLAILAPCISTCLAAMTSYAISRIHFKGSGFVLIFFLMTQMLPSAASVLSMYMLMARLGQINKLSTVILMLGAGGISFGIILLQGFIRAVPEEIEEAALIDGCTRSQEFFRIVLPLLKSGLFTVFIFQFINCWNDTYTSLVYLENYSTQTLPVLINKLVGKLDINWGQVAAGTTLSLIPTCVLFGMMKQFFVEGITAGSVKG